jgi:hypothetical protein
MTLGRRPREVYRAYSEHQLLGGADEELLGGAREELLGGADDAARLAGGPETAGTSEHRRVADAGDISGPRSAAVSPRSRSRALAATLVATLLGLATGLAAVTLFHTATAPSPRASSLPAPARLVGGSRSASVWMPAPAARRGSSASASDAQNVGVQGARDGDTHPRGSHRADRLEFAAGEGAPQSAVRGEAPAASTPIAGPGPEAPANGPAAAPITARRGDASVEFSFER